MTFADWLASQHDLGASPQIRIGKQVGGLRMSIMTWSDKAPGTWFWMVNGSTITLETFVGDDD